MGVFWVGLSGEEVKVGVFCVGFSGEGAKAGELFAVGVCGVLEPAVGFSSDGDEPAADFAGNLE